MIQTNHSAAVSWPVAGSSSTAAAVPPVLAVAPAAAASGDSRAALEQPPPQPRQAERDQPVAKAPSPAELQEQASEAVARREARAEAQRETIERLREALRKVWDASSAVVEQALAREAERAAAGEAVAGPRRPGITGIAGYSESPTPRGPLDPRFDERV